VLLLFVFELSDLLSEPVVEEQGVELELVSWLCARAPNAVSASARTDNATNLIETSVGWLCKRRLATADVDHNARPLARWRADRTS